MLSYQYSLTQQLECGTTPTYVASALPHAPSFCVGVGVSVSVHISKFAVIIRVPVNIVCIAGVSKDGS